MGRGEMNTNEQENSQTFFSPLYTRPYIPKQTLKGVPENHIDAIRPLYGGGGGTKLEGFNQTWYYVDFVQQKL